MCDARSRRAMLAFAAALIGVAGVRAQTPTAADWQEVTKRPDVIVVKESGQRLTGTITKIAGGNIYFNQPGKGEYAGAKSEHQVEHREGVTNAAALVRVGKLILDGVSRDIDEALPDTTTSWTALALTARAAHGADYLRRVLPDAAAPFAEAKAADPAAFTPTRVAQRLQKSLADRGEAVNRGRFACGDLAGAVAGRDFARAAQLAADAKATLAADTDPNPSAARVVAEFLAELDVVEKAARALAAESPEFDPNRTDPTRLGALAARLAREKSTAAGAAGLRLVGRPVAEAFAAHRDAAAKSHDAAKEYEMASDQLAIVIMGFDRHRDGLAATPTDRAAADRRFADTTAGLGRVRTALAAAPPGPATDYTRRHLEAFERQFPAEKLACLLRLDIHFAAASAGRVSDQLTLDAASREAKELDAHLAGLAQYKDAELSLFQQARRSATHAWLVTAATDCRGVVASRRLEDLTKQLTAVATRAAAVPGVGQAGEVTPLRGTAARVAADLDAVESDLKAGVAAVGGEPARVGPVTEAIRGRVSEARHARDLLHVWEAAVARPLPRTLAELDAEEAAVAKSRRDLPAEALPNYDQLRVRADGAVRTRAEQLAQLRPAIVFDHNAAAVSALLDAAAAHLRAERLAEGRVALVDAGDRTRELSKLSDTYPRLKEEPYPGRAAERVARHAELGTQADQLAARRRREAGWQAAPIDGSPLVPPAGAASRVRAELLVGKGRADEAGGLSADAQARVRFARAVELEAGRDWAAAAEAYRAAAELAPGRPIAAAADAGRVRALARADSEGDDSRTVQYAFVAAAAGLAFVAVLAGAFWLVSARGRAWRARGRDAGASEAQPLTRPASAPARREPPRLTPVAANLPAVVQYAITLPLTPQTGDLCLGWLEQRAGPKRLRENVVAWLRRRLSDCRGMDESGLRWAAAAAARCERLFPTGQWPVVCRLRLLAALGDDAAAVEAAARVRVGALNRDDRQAVLSVRALGLLRLGRYREALALLTTLQKQKNLPPDGERWLAVARAGVMGSDPASKARPDPELVARLLQDAE